MTAVSYKRFPPGLGHLRIPLSSRRAAAAGVALYTACRWSTLNLQRLAFVLTRTFGPRVLPGPISQWSPPFAAEVWSELQGTWRTRIGAFDTIAVYERHGHRQGFMSLLIDDGSPIAFVKLRRGSDALLKEAAAIRMAHGSGPRSFFVPRPLGSDTVQDWSYLATAPLPQGVHRVPTRPELHTILADVARALGGLSRPDDAAAHWQPMHGDFAPWNLRRCSDGRLVLFDWEAATWGPPRADEVFYLATHAALKGRQPDPHPAAEAIAFWLHRVTNGRARTTRDERLRRALANSLSRMVAAPR